MKLVQLEQLAAIHENGTFSKAAQALYITQPTLSVSIQELERELGTQLVIRGNRGTVFTPAGLAVLEQAKHILYEVGEIYQICDAAQLSGSVRIASTPHYCTSLLLDVKLAVEQSFASVSVNLEESDSGSILNGVKNNEIDIGLIQLCDVRERELNAALESGGVDFVELFDETLCISVSENHPLVGRGQVEVSELMNYPYGSYKNAMNNWIDALIRADGHNCRVFRVNDIDPLRILLNRENAFTVVPRRSIEFGNATYQYQMTPLPVRSSCLTSKVGLVYKEKVKTRLIGSVMDEVRRKSGEYLRNNPVEEQE